MEMTERELLEALQEYHNPPENPEDVFRTEDLADWLGVSNTTARKHIRFLLRRKKIEVVDLKYENIIGTVTTVKAYKWIR